MIALAALTASPATALAVGALFGLVRGLAVLLGRGIVSPATLAEFHRRFTRAGPVVLGAVVGCEMAVAVAFAAVLSPWVVLALVLLGATVAAGRLRRRTPAAAAVLNQPLMSTALTRNGTIRTMTRRSPGASCSRRSAWYLAPTFSAKARSSSGATTAVPRISR